MKEKETNSWTNISSKEDKGHREDLSANRWDPSFPQMAEREGGCR